MLFSFLKYINPVWYYNLLPANHSIPYFVDYRKLDHTEQGLINIDYSYNTEVGTLADAAYQAWHKGIMKHDPEFLLYTTIHIQSRSKPRIIKLFDVRTAKVSEDIFVKDIYDNYRFTRRFFNPGISVYILLLRIISFHNPVNELRGFIKSLKVKRVDLYKQNVWPLIATQYLNFISDLTNQAPLVSVVIPTLNRYTYLKDVLSDLENQDYKNFEVIVCDQSDNFDESFYKGWELDLVLLRQKEKALWLARNSSIRAAKGDYILLFDDDSRVNPDWITQHLKCLDFYKADISSGVSLSNVGNKVPENYYFNRWSDQIDTGNVMFRKDMMKTTGMFDRQFEKQRQGDGEFGLRCYLMGFTNISNHLAKRLHLKAEEGGLRQMGSWDGMRPKKFFAPRPVPSVLYLSRKYFGNHLSLLMLLLSVPGSIIPYRFKSNRLLKVLANVSFIITWPLIMIQVIISWRKADYKLDEGAKIELLN